MIVLRLSVLICCATLGLANSDAWSWTCPPVNEQAIVDVDKLLGRWFYVEFISPGQIKQEYNCRVLNISKVVVNSSLLFQYNETASKGTHRVTNITIPSVSPNKWLAGGVFQKVVDLPEDGKTLSISYCDSTLATAVFSRTSKIDLGPLHDRLRKVGVLGLNHAQTINRTDCAADREHAPKDNFKGAGCSLKSFGIYGLLLVLLLSKWSGTFSQY